MAAYHSDEILDGATLPLRYAAFSPCFRKEAGSHGKDTKGIIRVHWFDKVEMFVYTTVEDSYAEHQRLLEIEKGFLDKLELAYQVIDTAAGDLGLSAQRKFDCEAWIPTQGKYRELTSTSNCTDFQTRRLDTRGRFGGERGSGRNPQRHALRDDPHHRGHPRDPPAGRRLGAWCRRRCSRGWVATSWSLSGRDLRLDWRRAWSRSTSTAPCSSGSRARGIDVRADRAAGLRRRPPRARGRRPCRAGLRALAARHDPGRRPARPAWPGRRAGAGSWPATARWCSATRRSRWSTRRRSTRGRRSRRSSSGSPPPWWRWRSGASATASAARSPTGELTRAR